MKRLIIGAALVGALALSGCAAGGPANDPDVDGNGLNGSFTVGTIQVHGRPLECVKLEESAGNSARAGLSCDWVGYHEQMTAP